MALTFKALFSKQINTLKAAAEQKKLYSFSAKTIKDITDDKAIHLLELNEKELKIWDEYYAEEWKRLNDLYHEQRSTRGNFSATNKEKKKLETYNDIIQQEASASFSEIDSIKTKLIDDLGLSYLKNTQIGHTDVSTAMTRLVLLLKYSKLSGKGTKSPNQKHTAGSITLRQRALLKKALRVLQNVERLTSTDFANFQKTANKEHNGNLLLAITAGTKTKVSINATFIRQVLTNGANLTYGVKFQDTEENQTAGAIARELGTRVNKLLRTVDKHMIDNYIKNDEFGKLLIHVPGSLSWFDEIRLLLKNTFTGKLTKPINSTKTQRKEFTREPNKTVVAGIRAYKSQLKKLLSKVDNAEAYEKRVYNSIKGQESGQQFDILNLQSLINQVLAQSVKEQMGKSYEPPIRLRNQTGRFAESATLLTLTRAQNGILAGTYSYQRYPYDTFLPPLGRLATPRRDPRLYIEGGIRAAAIKILKNRFTGIELELK